MKRTKKKTYSVLPVDTCSLHECVCVRACVRVYVRVRVYVAMNKTNVVAAQIQ